MHNFGGNVQIEARHTYEPQSELEVLELLDRYCGEPIRAIGRLHSWSEAPQTTGVVLDLCRLQQVEVRHDDLGPIARIGAGCQIKRALKELDRHGLTLPALGLISEQTLAGATSTGTHGSGRSCTSHYLIALRLACYDGTTGKAVVRDVEAGEALRAAQCGLGCLGIVLWVELRPRPRYQIEEWLKLHDTLEEVLTEEATAPLQQFYYLPWLHKFLGQHRRESDRPRSWLAPLYRAYWFLTLDVGLHLALRFLVQRLRSPAGVKWFFRWLGVATVIRGWHVVDHSQDMLIMEHELFRHIEIELFVKRSQLPAAIAFAQLVMIAFDGGEPKFDSSAQMTLEQLGLREQLSPQQHIYTHHYPVCVRRVLPDDTLLSMSSGGDEHYYALSFISYALPHERAGFFAFADFIAHSMAAMFQARCHWGKYCPTSPEEASRLYPSLPAFREVCREFDSQAVFSNAWTRATLGLSSAR